MSVIQKEFGITSKNEIAYLFIITNSQGHSLSVTNYGATIVSLLYSSHNGQLLDMVLGYDSVQGYENNNGQLGALVGRNANRIKGASFKLNGKSYNLIPDQKGNNCHSGPDYYGKRLYPYEYEMTGNSVSFFVDSPHMDQGFPGHLKLIVTYTFTDQNELLIDYDAVSNADTLFNPTNHVYFNLTGMSSLVMGSHNLWVNASYITETDVDKISTGELIPVSDTIYDFCRLRALSDPLDHNWCLNGAYEDSCQAMLVCPSSGIRLLMQTDLPGLQVYTASFTHITNGKKGCTYEPFCGICLETQYYVDAIHHQNFKQPILLKNELFHSRTSYQFCTI